MRVCPACPDCNTPGCGRTPCQDEAGSSAGLVGGVFGRMDAAYVTIEAQKSTGSLHAHCQCFVQCLHQHTPLQAIFALAESKLEGLRKDYLEYNAHVMHGTYEGHSPEGTASKIAEAEASWPEHKQAEVMLQCPAYQRRRAASADSCAKEEATTWGKEYLQEDVATLQFLKQHHYHPVNAETGERTPLHGCQRAEKPGVCKSDFPRTDGVGYARGMRAVPLQRDGARPSSARPKKQDRGFAWTVRERMAELLPSRDVGRLARSQRGRTAATQAAVRMRRVRTQSVAKATEGDSPGCATCSGCTDWILLRLLCKKPANGVS